MAGIRRPTWRWSLGMAPACGRPWPDVLTPGRRDRARDGAARGVDRRGPRDQRGRRGAPTSACTPSPAPTRPDVRLLPALEGRGFAAELLVLNDAFGALRAGTDRAWGVVVICGQGVNAAGIAPDGQTARLDALGEISGDWGGGTDVGWAGLAAAVRATDGRGPRTRLEHDVPAHWGLATPAAVTEAFYTGRIALSTDRPAVTGRLQRGRGRRRRGAQDRRPAG